MANLPNFSLPADLPVNWQPNQIVSPDGVSVGLTAQHGYNTLSQYINNAQAAINQLREYLASAGFATDDGVADQLADYLPLAGGTLSGVLDHGGKRSANLGAPTAATDGATKGYVDTQAGLKLPLAGGTMTGIINHGGYRATNLGTPGLSADAATKGYVDERTVNRLICETGVYKGTGTKMSKTITCTERPRVLFIYGTQPSVKEIALAAYNFSLVTYSATNDGGFFPRSNIACSWDSKSLTLSDVSNNNLNNQIASYYYVVLEG